MNITVANGKYTVLADEKFTDFRALRYGEEWRDLCGDGLILALCHEIEELREKIERAKNCLVSSVITNPFEICETTLKILKRSSYERPMS